MAQPPLSPDDIMHAIDSDSRHIVYLCTCACRLTEVGGAIAQLTSLQVLVLAHNALTQLPAQLGQLSSLQRLDVRSNKLDILPEELSGCSMLGELDAADNCLRSLPDQLGQLQNLRSLLLDRNRYGSHITAFFMSSI